MKESLEHRLKEARKNSGFTISILTITWLARNYRILADVAELKILETAKGSRWSEKKEVQYFLERRLINQGFLVSYSNDGRNEVVDIVDGVGENFILCVGNKSFSDTDEIRIAPAYFNQI